MNYFEVEFSVFPNEDYVSDLLSASLADVGFESFEKTEQGLRAYCPEKDYQADAIDDIINNFIVEAKISYTEQLIQAQNWNEAWEKNFFEPIIIGTDCVIKSSFHVQAVDAKHTIIINPKMSFGTGHHETTSLMIQLMLDLDLSNKDVLDMGCGTAVLAILAKQKGAAVVKGIDIDEWAYNNSIENIELNNISDIEIEIGGAEKLVGQTYDYIFANINRNILLTDMHTYVAVLRNGGELYMSGFYKEDIPKIEEKANELGLKLINYVEKNNWVAVRTCY